jgi:hypothetical protein
MRWAHERSQAKIWLWTSLERSPETEHRTKSISSSIDCVHPRSKVYANAHPTSRTILPRKICAQRWVCTHTRPSLAHHYSSLSGTPAKLEVESRFQAKHVPKSTSITAEPQAVPMLQSRTTNASEPHLHTTGSGADAPVGTSKILRTNIVHSEPELLKERGNARIFQGR